MCAGGLLKVEPNPALEGGKVTITGPPGETVYVAIDGSSEKPREVVLDASGKGTAPVPVRGGRTFTVITGRVPPQAVQVEVLSPGR